MEELTEADLDAWDAGDPLGRAANSARIHFLGMMKEHDVVAVEERGGGESGRCAARTCTHASVRCLY